MLGHWPTSGGSTTIAAPCSPGPRRLESTIRATSSTLSEEECLRALVATGVSIARVVRSLSMASAADEKKSTPQQEKMKVCSLRKDQP